MFKCFRFVWNFYKYLHKNNFRKCAKINKTSQNYTVCYLFFQILQQPSFEQQSQLLALINNTYETLQSSLNERTSKLKKYSEATENNLEVLNSAAFKEFQATLTQTRQKAELASALDTNFDVIKVLDKYSNVLVGMIGSKLKAKDLETE